MNKLASENKALEDTKLNVAFPQHAKALEIAGIAPNIFPTSKEIKNSEISRQKRREKNYRRKKKRDVRDKHFLYRSESMLTEDKQTPPNACNHKTIKRQI